MNNLQVNISLNTTVIETAANGKALVEKESGTCENPDVSITLFPEKQFQTITGIGGSFTEASAYVLDQLGPTTRQRVIDAYFGKQGARYSLTRTHINSCDFSLGHYSYADVPGDRDLKNFTIDRDKKSLIPLIQEAIKTAEPGLKIIASPWTAPPWMKNNNNYVGGNLLPEYRETWALYFSKYLKAYQNEGISIWGITVENEPLGNGNNWESMHFTPDAMTDFVQHFLGPRLEADGLGHIEILGYDQNREHLKSWVDSMYQSEESSKYFNGTAVHWYASTWDVFPEALQYAHQKAPDKYLIQTEACVDADVPRWKDDSWYWSEQATDWGWDWAPAERKHFHPKYTPVFRYARDIIGCLNNWVDGWIDWNLILDRQGGPNWFKNWCVAPIIADPEQDELYFTPLYYTMLHFSRYIRPGAKRIHLEMDNESLLGTAVRNPDNSLVIVLLNQDAMARQITLSLDARNTSHEISAKAIQTIIIGQPDSRS